MRLLEDLKSFVRDENYFQYIVTIFTNPCFHSVCLFRISNFFYRIKLMPLAKIMWYINRLLFFVDIDYRANISGGFVLVHGLGVVIGKNVKTLGKVTVYQGVTIGGTGKERIIGENEVIDQPVIDDGVVIYTDSKVLGPVFIGKNNVIAAGRIIIEDMPDRK